MVDDSRLYANIAENWLQHGVYGITNSGVIMPTLSRLPGYPAFLAAIFAVFGVEIFARSCWCKCCSILATCFLIADLARRLFSPSAPRKAAFLLAALCPFLANYAASALTETLEIFFTALALDLVICADLRADQLGRGAAFRGIVWLGCGLSVGAAILLRPDGGILLAAIGGYLLWLLAARPAGQAAQRGKSRSSAMLLWAGVLVALGAPRLWFPGRCAICTHCIASSRWPRATPPIPTNW